MFVAIRQGNQRVLAFLAVLLFVGALQAWAAGNCIVTGVAGGIHFGWLLLDALCVAVLQYHASDPEDALRNGALTFLVAVALGIVLVVGSVYLAAGNWPHDIAWHKVVSFSVE